VTIRLEIALLNRFLKERQRKGYITDGKTRKKT